MAHGAVGIGILILSPWKSVIARRGLRRRAAEAWPSLAFAVLIALATAAGIGHATGLIRTLPGGTTAMQVHVGAALLSVPFGLWHVAARRVVPRATDVSRRALLRLGGLAAASLGAYGALAALVRAAGLPGSHRRFTGSYEAGSDEPERMPVTQWLNDAVPQLDATGWRLEIRAGGGVRSLGLEELDRMREPVRATLDCTGGWFAEQVWEGVRLDRLLPTASGRSIEVRSVTGYSRRFPVGDAHVLWLCTRVGGDPLSSGHGSPARLVAPGRRGFWWVKWVSSLEVGPLPWWWQPPFPLT